MNPSDHTGSSVYSGAVPRPSCWPFYIQDIAQLRAETERLGLALPLSEESKPLWKELVLKSRRIPNRWCAQPVAGNDALPGGAPSPLTLRRYTRCAAGGFGLIWVERVVVNPRARSRPGGGLAITRRNLGAFADFTRAVRRAARDSRFRAPVLILQLAHAGGRAFSDRDLVKARGQIIAAADFAARAGFDGVDIQCCGNSLPAKMLAAFERPGKYGGPFENRARFLRELVRGVRAKRPELLIAVRLNAYAACACPPGFGVAGGNYREPDLREPGKLAKFLREDGAALLNITANSPNLRAAPAERARLPFADCDIGDEHPLAILSRNLAIAGALRAAAPGLPVVIGGWTWLRQFIPAAAAGALRAGNADFIGLGRAALAYPELPGDLRRAGKLDFHKCCSLCQACLCLARAGARAGCVPRDALVYGPEYRRARRFSMPRLLDEARKCRNCEEAACRISVPGNLDIPAFIRAFEQDSLRAAFTVIRRANVLPEMGAMLAYAPPQRAGEANCVETIFSGRPVAIRDIMIAVSQSARARGWTGVRLPPEPLSGRRVAVVGGGPSGLAAAAVLLERGHAVTIFESRKRLGGVPEILIPAARFPGAAHEIRALFKPALEKRRLDIRFGAEFGRTGPDLDRLQRSFDAVLLAAGLWRNLSLGDADGVADAACFLERAKAGRWTARLDSAAVLSGGDCAMDSSAAALALGARKLYIIFPGPRAEMHWCAEEIFFKRPGVHALMLTRPLGYETNAKGKLTGLRVCPLVAAPDGSWRDVPGSRYTIAVDAVFEAAGLRPAASLVSALPGLRFLENGLLATRRAGIFQTDREGVYAAGALVNGGASVPQCVAEGMGAAEEIHRALTALP